MSYGPDSSSYADMISAVCKEESVVSLSAVELFTVSCGDMHCSFSTRKDAAGELGKNLVALMILVLLLEESSNM